MFRLKTAVDLVLALPRRCPDLETLHFVRYRPGAGLDRRLLQDPITREAAVRVRRAGAPEGIWDAMIRANPSDARVLSRMFDLALRHLGGPGVARREGKPIAVETTMLEGRLPNLLAELSSGEALALHSRVTVRGCAAERHLPMMDFVCAPSSENLDALRGLLERLGQGRGAIVHSGHSYHYYGFEPLTCAQWSRFLMSSLLVGGFTDARYIVHCLIERRCCLRITNDPERGGPNVVQEFVRALPGSSHAPRV